MQRNVTRFALGLVAGACMLWAAKVSTDYSHSTDFGRYKTYSWLKVDAGNPLWPERIRGAVDNALSAKGWTQVPSGGDAAVVAVGSSRNEQRLQTFYDGFGGGWFWRGFGPETMATTTVENIPVGTLIVDIFDAASKKLIWRGMASETLSEKPAKNEKKLKEAADDLFKHFPPQSKG